MGHFARECRAPRSKEGRFKYQDNTRKQGNNEDTSLKAMLAINGVGFNWSDMTEEQVQTNMALMAFSDSELNQTKFIAGTYKRGLATVKDQLITYRKNEVLFSKEVAVLKREVACKNYEINVLKSKFEKVKQEKEGIEFKIEKFDNASKSQNKLLESQITDKNPEFKSYGFEDSKQESNIKSVGASSGAQILAFMMLQALAVLMINGFEVTALSAKYEGKRYFQRIGKKIFINANDIAGYDKTKVECFNYHKMGHFARECRAPRSKEGFNWSDMTEEQVQTNMALMAFSALRKNGVFLFSKRKLQFLSREGRDPEFKSYGFEDSKQESNIVCDKKSNDSKENSDDSLVKEQVSEDTSSLVESSLNVDKETVFLVDKKIEFVKLKNHEKPAKKSVRGGAYGGNISGKGTLKTDSLDFEDVYFGLHVKRGWDTKIPQSSGPLVKVGDEAVHKELGDRMERAATTASSLEAEQDSGNINRT
ncbi:retrovirus-related pol polyprotein from transposon TNT 1-94 [Tanacetum coccineum]